MSASVHDSRTRVSVWFMDNLSDITAWGPVFAALSPVLAALVVKSDGSSNVRAAVSAVAAVLLAIVDHLVIADASATFDGLVVVAIVATVVQVGAYLAVWQHVGVNDRVVPTVGLQ